MYNIDRKGVMFAVGIIIAAFIIFSFFFYTLIINESKKEPIFYYALDPLIVQNYVKEINFYIEESAELSYSQAMYKLLSNFHNMGLMEGECKKLELGFIFDKDCVLSSEKFLENRFIEIFNSTFNSYLEKSDFLKEQKISFKISFNDRLLNIYSTKNLSYFTRAIEDKSKRVSYYFNPSVSISVDLSTSDLVSLYRVLRKYVKTCESIIKCIEKDKSDINKKFDIDVIEKKDYFIFKILTKKRFLFKDSSKRLQYNRLGFSYIFSKSIKQS